MEKLTIEQYEFIKELSEKVPSHYTLKDIINMNDLNPYITDKVSIENVEFHIEGVLKYAYECTGEIREFDGTIKDIIYELVGDDIFNRYGDADTKMVKVKDIWSKSEIKELAMFFLGDREETHLDDVTATANRIVTIEELINYIRELDVVEDFTYKETVLEY